MSQPTQSQVHVDAALTDFSIAYIQEDKNFIAGQVFPAKPVQHQSDKYFVFNKDDWRRDDAVKKRAPGEQAPRSGFRLGADSYMADSWWTAVPISDLLKRNADPVLGSLDQAATQLVTQRMLIRRELEFVSSYFTTGVWATDKVGGTDFTVWDDYASDPQRDIQRGQAKILQETGQMANCLTVGFRVHQALKRHPLVKDMYKYVSEASITEAMIARAFELDKYVVSKASYNTNAEGATVVTSFAAGANAMLTVSNDAPSIMTPCAGAIYDWAGLNVAQQSGVAIDQYFDIDTKDDIVRGEFAYDMKCTGTDLGYFFSGAIADNT
ncbi:hypothetical protein [Paraburkholderia fungorum]|uniref:hypothetical protein n=1 Tax=Paraburkholderia fungorum TaxID=134537 RepID=UPI003D6A6105